MTSFGEAESASAAIKEGATGYLLKDTTTAKLHNTTKARVVLAEARDLLGRNGILLDYHVMRHMADVEAVHTFKGTETVQTLVVGRDITGVSAFA